MLFNLMTVKVTFIYYVWKHTCNMSSGVEIIPPHRVTRARVKEVDHLTTSSRSISSAIALIDGFDTRMALIKSFKNRDYIFVIY